MTLVEFLHPIKAGAQRDLVVATMYFLKRYKGRAEVTAPEVRAALVATKLVKKTINVNDVINKSAPYVHSPGGKENGALLFALTDMGEQHVRELLGLPSVEPEIEHDVVALTELAASLTDEHVRGYVEEAISCLQFGLLRAAVVFLWSGAIRTLQERALAGDEKKMNAAIQKLSPKARTVKAIEDFGWINDRTFLEACPDIGLLDKTEKTTLVGSLDLRNSCGHPTKYKPGVKKVSAFIEDVLGIVFPD